MLKIEGIHSLFSYIYYFGTKIGKGFYETLAEEIVSELKEGKILDVGTGPGHLPIEVAKRAVAIEVVGIDISSSMIRIAKKYASREEVEERVKFKVMSAYNLEFMDSYFDLVISSCVLHHLKYPAKAFNEIYRVLKPNREAWIWDRIIDASSEEMKLLQNEMRIPSLPFLNTFLRLHGLRYDEYLQGSIKEAIEESLFCEYEFKKRHALMKIILRR